MMNERKIASMNEVKNKILKSHSEMIDRIHEKISKLETQNQHYKRIQKLFHIKKDKKNKFENKIDSMEGKVFTNNRKCITAESDVNTLKYRKSF